MHAGSLTPPKRDPINHPNPRSLCVDLLPQKLNMEFAQQICASVCGWPCICRLTLSSIRHGPFEIRSKPQEAVNINRYICLSTGHVFSSQRRSVPRPSFLDVWTEYLDPPNIGRLRNASRCPFLALPFTRLALSSPCPSLNARTGRKKVGDLVTYPIRGNSWNIKHL